MGAWVPHILGCELLGDGQKAGKREFSPYDIKRYHPGKNS